MIWLYLFLFFGVFKLLLLFFFFFTVNGVALESRNWWGSDILTKGTPFPHLHPEPVEK